MFKLNIKITLDVTSIILLLCVFFAQKMAFSHSCGDGDLVMPGNLETVSKRRPGAEGKEKHKVKGRAGSPLPPAPCSLCFPSRGRESGEPHPQWQMNRAPRYATVPATEASGRLGKKAPTIRFSDADVRGEGSLYLLYSFIFFFYSLVFCSGR